MNRKMAVWFAVTLASLAVGGVLGYVLALSWFIFRVFFLGYGDSGPSWIDTVSDALLFIGVLLSVVGGQVLFISQMRRQSASSVPGGAGADIRDDRA